MKTWISLLTLFISSHAFCQNLSLEWVNTIENTRPYDIVVSENGYVYSTGHFTGLKDFDPSEDVFTIGAYGTEDDVFIQKLDTANNFVWAVALTGSDNDKGTHLAIDSEENVYVAGTFRDQIDFDGGPGVVTGTSLGLDDVFLVKYSPDGEFLWKATFGGNTYDNIGGLAIDQNGDVIIGGNFNGVVDFDPGEGEYFIDSGNESAAFVVKLSSSGEFISYYDLNNSNEGGRVISISGIKIDSQNNLLLSGSFEGNIDFDQSTENEHIVSVPQYKTSRFILKLDSDFNFQWVNTFRASYNLNVRGLEINLEDEIIIMGTYYNILDMFIGGDTLTINSPDSQNMFILKVDESGAFVWNSFIETNGNGLMQEPKFRLDPMGDVYITGAFNGTLDLDPGIDEYLVSTNSQWNIYIQKLSGTDGSFHFGLSAGNYTQPSFSRNIFASADGSIYTAGTFRGTVDFDPSPDGDYLLTGTSFQSPAFFWKLKQCLPSFSEIAIESCNSYLVPSGNVEYFESGTYIDTIPSMAGCDSVMTLNVTILESSTSTTTATSCEEYFWPENDTTYFESGEYATTIENVAGCDSVITLVLTINQSTEIAETESSCESFLWEVTGETLSESGIYQGVFETYQGCDSTRTLDLTILDPTTSEINVSDCDSYASPSGEIYTTAGTFEDVILNTAGCDSIITIHLELGYATSSAISDSACFTYTSQSGVAYSESGNYTETLVNSQGCDSIVNLDLTVFDVNVSIENNDSALTAMEPSATYQWLNCGESYSVIENETNQVFIPTQSGSYAVEVTTAHCTDTSDCIIVSLVSVQNNSFDQLISVYPNPSSGNIYLKLEQEIRHADIEIYTTDGKRLSSYSGNLYSGMLLPINPKVSGIFVIKIRTEDKVATFRVVKLTP